MPVHLFGQSAEMAPILEIAERSGVPVVEDAAQAIGARYRGQARRGHRHDRLLLVFSDEEPRCVRRRGPRHHARRRARAKVRAIRQHGGEVKYHHDVVGANFRLDALQAAILRVKLPHLAGWTAARQRNAERYEALFAKAGSTAR